MFYELVIRGKVDFAEYILLNYMADSMRYKKGRDTISRAVSFCCYYSGEEKDKVIEMLLSNGIDLNKLVRNNDNYCCVIGESFYETAQRSGNKGASEILKKYGYDAPTR